LKLTKKGIMVTNTLANIMPGDKEPIDDKYFISFPTDEILEYCTLSVIGDDVFALKWDDTQEEFDNMLNYYFDKLKPYLKKYQEIQKYYRDKKCDLSVLDYDTKRAVQTKSKKDFMYWYDAHDDTFMRKKGWKEFLTASSVISARKTTSRTVHKCQGVSIPAIVVCRDSFYSASKDAIYVALTRGKQGIILLDNIPEWKDS